MCTNLLILSHYNPYVAGGNHRHRRFMDASLKNRKKVYFIFVSLEEEYMIPTSLDNNLTLIRASESDLYLYRDGKTHTILASYINQIITSVEFCRAHHPSKQLFKYYKLCHDRGVYTIYDAMDDWECFITQPWGKSEIDYVKNSNLVSSITTALSRKLKEKYDVDIPFLTISNGLHFKPLSKGGEYRDSKNIIYTGALWPSWIDWKIIEKAVYNFSKNDFIFVGSVNHPKEENHRTNAPDKVKNLNKYNNFHYFEEVPHRDLGKYFEGAKTGIVPFKEEQLTYNCSPLKIFDYLSYKCFVVIPKICDLKPSKYMFLSVSEEEFLKNLEDSLKANFDDYIDNVNMFLEMHDWKYLESQFRIFK